MASCLALASSCHPAPPGHRTGSGRFGARGRPARCSWTAGVPVGSPANPDWKKKQEKTIQRGEMIIITIFIFKGNVNKKVNFNGWRHVDAAAVSHS